MNVTSKPIVKGSIVKYKDGHMEVTARFKNTVNLSSIFHGKTSIKGVPIDEVVEDQEAWYSRWQQSETYMSM